MITEEIQAPDEVADVARKLKAWRGELSDPLPEYRPKPAPLPYVFQEIIINHNQRCALRDKSVAGTMTREDWRWLRILVHDHKTNLRPSAEKALCWNTDKGDY